MCDVAAVLHRHEAELNWNSVATTAERWRAQLYVRFVLRLSREQLGAPLQDWQIDGLPCVPHESEMIDNARTYILNRTVMVPTAVTSVARSNGWAMKVRSIRHSIFPHSDRLAAMYRLPEGSRRIYLWYVLRPFDLVLRKGLLSVALLVRRKSWRRFRAREQSRLQLIEALDAWRSQVPRSGDDLRI